MQPSGTIQPQPVGPNKTSESMTTVGASVSFNILSMDIEGLIVGGSIVSQMGSPSSIISGGWHDSNSGLH